MRSTYLSCCRPHILADKVLVSVLHHDDRAVDHHADGNGDTAQTHDVGTHPQKIKHGKARDHAAWNDDDGDQTASSVEQKKHTHQRHDDHLFGERIGKGVDSAVDEVIAVITRPD